MLLISPRRAQAAKAAGTVSMANSTYEILGFHCRILPHATEIYVLCGPPSDGTLSVQGWHKKTFPPDRPSLEILDQVLRSGEYLLWGLESPHAQSS